MFARRAGHRNSKHCKWARRVPKREQDNELERGGKDICYSLLLRWVVKPVNGQKEVGVWKISRDPVFDDLDDSRCVDRDFGPLEPFGVIYPGEVWVCIVPVSVIV